MILISIIKVFIPNYSVNAADEDEIDEPIVKENIGKSKVGSKTDDEVIQR
jgi:hypothetical protein